MGKADLGGSSRRLISMGSLSVWPTKGSPTLSHH